MEKINEDQMLTKIEIISNAKVAHTKKGDEPLLTLQLHFKTGRSVQAHFLKENLPDIIHHLAYRAEQIYQDQEPQLGLKH